MQRASTEESATLTQIAKAESAGVRRALESEGVQVVMAKDTPSPAKPDALFPNNWVSFHADGTLVLYSMLSRNRRLERRAEVVDEVCATLGYRVRRRIDLSVHEASGRFLEGTGSLVLDHVGRVAYACRSPRTDESLVHEWARAMNFSGRGVRCERCRRQALLPHQRHDVDRHPLRRGMCDRHRRGRSSSASVQVCVPASAK